MIDPTDIELLAMRMTSANAGEYLESMPTTDLAKFTSDQWTDFIRVTCGGYVMNLIKLRMQSVDAMQKVESA